MEEARLARQGSKRKRDNSISPPQVPPKDAHSQKKVKGDCSDPASKLRKQDGMPQSRSRTSTSPPVDSRLPASAAFGSAKNSSQPKPGKRNLQAEAAVYPLQYPEGVVKKTYSAYHERGNDITIEEVLQKDKLRTAIFSSFQWDLDWLFSKVDMRKTKMVLVMGVNSKAAETTYMQQAAEQGLVNVRMCFPKLLPKGGSIMHSKLMLLFYETYMRVVVPTANLVDYDWGEKGLIENTIFLIDLPRRSDGKQGSVDNLTSFGKALRSFLQRMDMQNNVIDGIMNFDYSKTTDLGFVYSAAGEYTFDPSVHPPELDIGYMGLHREVKGLHLATEEPQLDYVTSSLGLLDTTLLRRMHYAAMGPATTPAEPSKAPTNGIKVYFPSTQTIKESMGGPDNAGTICLRQKHIHTRAFQRDVLKDHRPTRVGLLSHSKIMFVRGVASQTRIAGNAEDRTWKSWAYIGSANLTASAWGTISKVGKGASRKEVLLCRNWECGVILPGRVVTEKKPSQPDGQVVPRLKEMFEGVMEVPFDEKETSYEGKEPWLFDTHV